MKPDNSNKKLTVILPCAGAGSRLGLKTPKELFDISTTCENPKHMKPVKLIDYSLQHIRSFPSKKRLKVAVVIQPWKKDVSQYVEEQLPGIEVETIIFNPDYKEWPGSVFSAGGTFSEFNMVLLPDSYLSLSKKTTPNHVTTIDSMGKSLLQHMQETLTHHSVVFGSINCNDPDTLKSMGALSVKNGLVTNFQDKPSDSISSFNAYWGCYGFRKDIAQALYHFLISSVQHHTLPLKDQIFNPPATITIPTYYDLGTWDRIKKLIK
jgi:hypothetical protein